MRIKLIVILLIFGKITIGQNLIQNPSFEVLNSCSSGPSAIYNQDAPPWQSPSENTADVFDTCSTFPIWKIPSNFAGYQTANSGKAYAGAMFYPSPEYLQIELESPMIANETYNVSFYVNLGGKVGIATKNIGLYISSSNIYSPTLSYLNYNPQIIDTTFITDTTNWTLISGQYTAQGGESHIVIGKFSNSNNDTLHVNTGSSNPVAYYYIDDVDVHCSSCEGTSNVSVFNKSEQDIIIYPNPAQDEISLDLKSKYFTNYKIEIVNTLGTTFYLSYSSLPVKKINIRHFPPGIYMVHINNNNINNSLKFIKE